jgi:hypothetical protein
LFIDNWSLDNIGQQQYTYERNISRAVDATPFQLKILQSMLDCRNEVINMDGKNYQLSQRDVVKKLFILFRGRKIETK